MAEKEMQVKEKAQLATEGEQTKEGPVFIPNVDIFESPEAITVVADLPGVSPEKINIDVRENELTIEGDVDYNIGENERMLLQEYDMGKYYRKFSLSNVIDQSKISASMSDGVLRLVLPKVEEAKPRKIEVKTA